MKPVLIHVVLVGSLGLIVTVPTATLRAQDEGQKAEKQGVAAGGERGKTGSGAPT